MKVVTEIDAVVEAVKLTFGQECESHELTPVNRMIAASRCMQAITAYLYSPNDGEVDAKV